MVNEGASVARYEKLFDAAAEAALDEAELALLARHFPAASGESREAILARFLSGTEDSGDAVRNLGGSFSGKAVNPD